MFSDVLSLRYICERLCLHTLLWCEYQHAFDVYRKRRTDPANCPQRLPPGIFRRGAGYSAGIRLFLGVDMMSICRRMRALPQNPRRRCSIPDRKARNVCGSPSCAQRGQYMTAHRGTADPVQMCSGQKRDYGRTCRRARR